jgi:SAM-dependent methyltransferase
VQPPEIFHRAARRLRRDRIAASYRQADFLRRFMTEGLSERLDAVTRQFADVLDLGCFDAGLELPGTRIVRADPGFAFARAAGGVQCDEDRLPFADGSFDLIVSAGTLDQVNDLPGALTLIRRTLRPDGLFLAAFTGGATLATLRATLMAAEQERPAARVHPQVNLHSAGDLLMRAGFALPVADSETLNVRYAGFGRLVEDLRGMAATSLLVDRAPLPRAALAQAAERFSERADAGGRVPEQFEVIYLTGWAPSPDQPKPARRGSGTVSLAEALRPKR